MNMISIQQKIQLLMATLLLSISTVNASVYITKVINNTKQNIVVEYSVPARIKASIPGGLFGGPNHHTALLSHGIEVKTSAMSKLGIHLNIGTYAVCLEGAYIPTARNPFDFSNVITIKIGSDFRTIRSIRTCDGYLEKTKSYNVFSRVFEEKLVAGSDYTLEVRQISDEIYFNEPRVHVTTCDTSAFEVILTKN